MVTQASVEARTYGKTMVPIATFGKTMVPLTGEKHSLSGEIPNVWGLKRQNYGSNAAKVWVKLHPRR